MRLNAVCALMLIVPAAAAADRVYVQADPTDPPPAGYERRTIQGFTVYLNKVVLQHPTDRWNRQPLAVLEKELNDLRRILHPKIFATLRREVPLWVEWDQLVYVHPGRMVPGVAKYRMRPYSDWKKGQEAQADEWRKSMQKLNPHSGSIEVCSLRLLTESHPPGSSYQQVMLLHELAHAVHDRLLGWQNPDLAAAFQQAVDRKLYDQVNDRSGRRTKAFARTDDLEYFAELSCAYLDSCNYFPFNYEQLRAYDPVGFAFVERVWKHPERPAGGDPKPAGPERSVFSERAAQLQLDRLKAKAKNGPTDEVRTGLAEIVRNFPGTAAADEARRLLKAMD